MNGSVRFKKGITMENKKVACLDWGLIDYKAAWERQEELFGSILKLKTTLRDQELNLADAHEAAIKTGTPNYMVFCQHPHVYTLGKSGKAEHLLLDEQELKERGAAYYRINRGGDITYHGPGQLLCYPILDLDNFFTDIHLYLRTLEEAVIRTLSDYGLNAARYPGYTGVWFDAETPRARKIAAMGVRASRWVTMHGLSFNINTDLDFFNDIIPCGIEDKAVTSMEAELGHTVNVQEIQTDLTGHLARLFRMEFI